MVRSNQDNGVIETNCVIWVIGQMPSDVRFLWCFRRRIVVISDGHSGAVHQRRYFFGSGSAAAFFRHQRQAAGPLFFTAAPQRSILSKYSAAAATANKLLSRLFSIHIFTRYRLESFLSAFFTLLFLPRYFSLVEQKMLLL